MQVRYAPSRDHGGATAMNDKTPPDENADQAAGGEANPPTLKTIAFMTGLGVTTADGRWRGRARESV